MIVFRVAVPLAPSTSLDVLCENRTGTGPATPCLPVCLSSLAARCYGCLFHAGLRISPAAGRTGRPDHDNSSGSVCRSVITAE